MANKRKKRIVVRYHNLNGDELVLERKVLSIPAVVMSAFFLFTPMLFGYGWVWRPWKLLNSELYQIEEKMIKKLEEIEKLWLERLEVEERLKNDKKEVTDSTRMTFGFSDEFTIEWPVDDLSFKKQKWMNRPPQEWKRFLNPKAFPGLRPQRQSTRQKVGMDDDPPAAVRSAYTIEELSPYKMTLEENLDSVDHVMAWKDPDKNRNKNQQQNRNKNRQRNNNQNNQNNDWDD